MSTIKEDTLTLKSPINQTLTFEDGEGLVSKIHRTLAVTSKLSTKLAVTSKLSTTLETKSTMSIEENQ